MIVARQATQTQAEQSQADPTRTNESDKTQIPQ